MKKKRKLKKKVVVFIVIIGILIISTIGIILYKSFASKTGNVSKVVDEIPEYGYVLEDDQPKVYKDLFKKLADVLKKDPVNDEEYAKLISQMVVIDFYNLENKVSKNDVGGTQFISSKNVNNFVLEASETVYKYIEQDIYGDRKQELPSVKASSVKDVKQEPYRYKNVDDDKAYVVTVNLEYKEDLGYPTEMVIKLLHNDKKLEVYEMK